MTKYLMLFLIACTFTSMAQVTEVAPVTETVTTSMKPGAPLAELASSIQPNAFLKSFNNETWKNNLNNVANPMALGRSLTDLVLGLSPDAFDSNWQNNKNGWLSKAKGLSKFSDAPALLKELEGSLSPALRTSDWAGKKAAWLKSLENIK